MSLEHYVVLVVDADNNQVFERADEVPELFASVDLAEEGIRKFLERADNAGFSYSRSDFVICRYKP